MYPMRNSIGVAGMGWRSQRASKRILACLAVFGVGGSAGLLAGFSADPVQTSELSPAEIVALRFPGDSSRIASNHIVRSAAPVGIDSSPTPAGYVLASAGEGDPQASSLLFNPFPTYSSPAYSSPTSSSPTSPSPKSSPPSRPSLPPQLVTASAQIPAAALAYAAVDADDRAEPAMPVARPESANAAAPAVAQRAIQPPHPASPSAASLGPASPSNAVLNNAQIASIRERLKLTSYQSQLWPAVESALRDIAWQGHPETNRKVASKGRGSIDPNSMPVQRLKSAAFPLIMSLSEDQKQEVRTMVRLMGLENLASQF
jgi:hypothetical protein